MAKSKHERGYGNYLRTLALPLLIGVTNGCSVEETVKEEVDGKFENLELGLKRLTTRAQAKDSLDSYWIEKLGFSFTQNNSKMLESGYRMGNDYHFFIAELGLTPTETLYINQRTGDGLLIQIAIWDKNHDGIPDMFSYSDYQKNLMHATFRRSDYGYQALIDKYTHEYRQFMEVNKIRALIDNYSGLIISEEGIVR
ncbi:hypothetical protein HYT57_02765 [Candidatus Woesearchaeota archaeon]|nr:hypothetical protein [Candidatus Woesearchaeota archaeon]